MKCVHNIINYSIRQKRSYGCYKFHVIVLYLLIHVDINIDGIQIYASIVLQRYFDAPHQMREHVCVVGDRDIASLCIVLLNFIINTLLFP